MTRVSVLIPTFRRPDSFVRAARSVLAQTRCDGHRNHRRRQLARRLGARHIPQASKLKRQLPFRWAHEPKPGVAQARNAAREAARRRIGRLARR